MSEASQGYPGYFGQPQGEEVNNADFMIDQAAARISKMQPVKVIAVYPGDNATKPTTVDVQPMVDMVDPAGNRTPHGIIYGVIAARYHGGGTAVLIDPAIGDVGMMHVADRDTSTLYANGGKQSPPGSGRRHDMADGHYHGGLYTVAPTNSIDLRNNNMVHTTPGMITHNAQGPIAHTSQTSITHTAANGDMTHSAPNGAITHTAMKGISLNGGSGGIGLSLPTTPGPSGTLWSDLGSVKVA
jgi:hypothetical protein